MRPIARRTLLGGLLVLPVAARAADAELAKDSTLEGVLRRGQLRVGFEAGYMPFQMIDKRAGLRQRDLRPADVRRGGQQASFIGFDIDIAREMATELGVKFVPVHTRWTSIIPALRLGRFDIIETQCIADIGRDRTAQHYRVLKHHRLAPAAVRGVRAAPTHGAVIRWKQAVAQTEQQTFARAVGA